MTCPTCKSFICYVCRQLIPKNVSYKHFCQTPHCQHHHCKKCPLYSNAEEDDKRAAKEAGLKALEEIQKEQQGAENGDGNEKTKRIDVDELLRAPPSTTSNGTRTNGVNRHIVGMPHPPFPQQQHNLDDWHEAIMRRIHQDFLNRLGRR